VCKYVKNLVAQGNKNRKNEMGGEWEEDGRKVGDEALVARIKKC
jgi:hypothetical protein